MWSRPNFWENGPSPGLFNTLPAAYGKPDIGQRTMNPTTTGTSVLGITFDGGVMLAADVLGSYGSLARFRQCERVLKVNNATVLSTSGDFADYQFLKDIIEKKVINEECMDDGFNLKPKSLYCWLTRLLYNRRSKFDPLWTTFLVGGLQDGVPFLGHVDKIGTAFEAPHIATGYGAYIALPMLRDAYEKNPKMTQEEAKKLLIDCLTVLYYRDARSFDKIHIATVTEEGATMEGPLQLTTNWEVGNVIQGYE